MARRTWYRLDNIGKFYSSQAGRSSQTVFRYSADLADDIDPDILQHALDHAIAQFPSFNVHLLNGMFWHYLEQSDGRPLVEPEHLPICSRLHYGPKSMLFRVSYFRNRVNLESRTSFRTVAAPSTCSSRCCTPTSPSDTTCRGVPSDYDGSDSDKAENSFDKYYEKDKAGAAPGTKIYRLAGPIDRAAPTFMEYHVSASKVLGAAHQCGVSLTSYSSPRYCARFATSCPRAPQSRDSRGYSGRLARLLQVGDRAQLLRHELTWRTRRPKSKPMRTPRKNFRNKPRRSRRRPAVRRPHRARQRYGWIADR